MAKLSPAGGPRLHSNSHLGLGQYQRFSRRHRRAAIPATDFLHADYWRIPYRQIIADHRPGFNGGWIRNGTCHQISNTRIVIRQCGYLKFTSQRPVWRVNYLTISSAIAPKHLAHRAFPPPGLAAKILREAGLLPVAFVGFGHGVDPHHDEADLGGIKMPAAMTKVVRTRSGAVYHFGALA